MLYAVDKMAEVTIVSAKKGETSSFSIVAASCFTKKVDSTDVECAYKS